MRRAVVLALCTIGAFVVPSSARAAIEVRLSIKPTSPEVGVLTVVELRTYYPYRRADGSCCRLTVADPIGYPFRVQAVSPTGAILRVRVARVRRGLWRGNMRFGRAGRWQLRVTNYGPTYKHAPGARPRMWFAVRS